MFDGETEEEAILMGKDAVEAWINTAKQCDRAIPKPSNKKETLSLS